MALVTLHGKLGETVGKKEWNLQVKSVSEAFAAINAQSQDSIRKFFIKRENAYSRYDVLVNKEKTSPSDNTRDNDLTLERGDIESIDIVPVLEGSFLGWAGLLLGGVGLGLANNPMSAMMALNLLFQGASYLLSEPPEMPEQRQITNPSSDPTQLANSYLFSGPVNVLNEGGPVPIGYGRLIVGSQVIMSAYGVKRVLVREAGRVR